MKSVMLWLLAGLFSCVALSAQEINIQSTVERYKDMNTLTATVVRTKHNVAITDDVVTKGKFYFKRPSKVCLTFDEGKDKLLMDGSTFTMVTDGKKSTTQAQGNSQFESFQSIFKGLISGEDSDVNINDLAEVDITKEGDTCTLSVTPIVSDAKEKRKQLFSSFVLVIDLQSSELKNLRMNERGENYTQYDFSDYVFDGEVSDSVFNP